MQDNVNYVAIRRETCRRTARHALSQISQMPCPRANTVSYATLHSTPKKKRIECIFPDCIAKCHLNANILQKTLELQNEWNTFTIRKYFTFTILFFYICKVSLPPLWMIIYIIIVNNISRSIPIDSTMTDSKLSGGNNLQSIWNQLRISRQTIKQCSVVVRWLKRKYLLALNKYLYLLYWSKFTIQIT